MKSKSLRFLIFSVVGISFFSLLSAQTRSQENHLAKIDSCLPDFVAYYEVVSEAEVEARKYYWLSSYTLGNSYPMPVIVSTQGNTCREEFKDLPGHEDSFAPTIGQEPARLLMLDYFRRTIDLIGREGFEKDIQLQIQQGYVFPDEEVWALAQLGFDLQTQK